MPGVPSMALSSPVDDSAGDGAQHDGCADVCGLYFGDGWGEGDECGDGVDFGCVAGFIVGLHYLNEWLHHVEVGEFGGHRISLCCSVFRVGLYRVGVEDQFFFFGSDDFSASNDVVGQGDWFGEVIEASGGFECECVGGGRDSPLSPMMLPLGAVSRQR